MQHVLTSNVAGLEWNTAQYCIIPASDGSAVDDAYLYRFEEDRYLLVVNAANTAKDLAHLEQARRNYNCTITNITSDYAAIAVQGPKSKELLQVLSGGAALTEPMRNALNTLTLEGRPVRIAKTGYTGEPLGYEVYIRSQDAPWLWNRLVELGAKPAGLGARDTLRLEAALPLYGHEMGVDPDGVPMPIFAVPLAKFAVSFAPQKRGLHRPGGVGAPVWGFSPDHESGVPGYGGPASPDSADYPAGPGRHAVRYAGLSQWPSDWLGHQRYDGSLLSRGRRGAGDRHFGRDRQAGNWSLLY